MQPVTGTPSPGAADAEASMVAHYVCRNACPARVFEACPLVSWFRCRSLRATSAQPLERRPTECPSECHIGRPKKARTTRPSERPSERRAARARRRTQSTGGAQGMDADGRVSRTRRMSVATSGTPSSYPVPPSDTLLAHLGDGRPEQHGGWGCRQPCAARCTQKRTLLSVETRPGPPRLGVRAAPERAPERAKRQEPREQRASSMREAPDRTESRSGRLGNMWANRAARARHVYCTMEASARPDPRSITQAPMHRARLSFISATRPNKLPYASGASRVGRLWE